jgi:hypothetical protein
LAAVPRTCTVESYCTVPAAAAHAVGSKTCVAKKTKRNQSKVAASQKASGKKTVAKGYTVSHSLCGAITEWDNNCFCDCRPEEAVEAETEHEEQAARYDQKSGGANNRS